jgi:WD40 repeat protein/predicted Ser/Thr protein kinase
MTTPADSRPDGMDSPPGCPGIAALESLAERSGSRGEVPGNDPTAVHVRACGACASKLREMRSADEFLERFRDVAARSGYADALNADAWAGLGPGTTPVQVEGYTVERLLAFGGQGAVYRALQKGTDRLVAIKVPLGDTKHRPATRYRFEREVELAARLDHPGVVRIFGACTLQDGRLGYVMEYVEGQSLDSWASERRAEGHAGLRRIVEVVVQVADAIGYAHLRAVLHRDIKPGNVIVTEGDKARVLDFGLAKSLDSTGSSFATMTGAFLGTLAYAAPEQIDGGNEAIDVRTDVYALGLLLYQALTGRLPYSTDVSATELLRHIRNSEPIRPSAVAPDVAPDLDAIVLKAIAKEKERRYITAGEFRDDLRAWLAGRAVRARFDSRWYVMRKTVRHHRLSVIAGAASLIVALVIGALGLLARDQAAKTKMADAVRDAQIVESHHVRMAEARGVSADNFEAGEVALWDSLLEPASALIERGIEGVGASGLPAASPTYWALWETYLLTPIVTSLPDLSATSGTFAEEEGQFITAGANGLTWWDWRTHQRLRQVEPPAKPAHVTSRWGQLMVFCPLNQVLVSDSSGTQWQQSDPSGIRTAYLGDGRVATMTLDRRSWVIWDTTQFPLREAARFSTPSAETTFRVSAAFDRSGRYFGFIDESGRVTIVDSHLGDVVFEQSSASPSVLTHLTSFGEEGGFAAWGQDGSDLIISGGLARPFTARSVPPIGTSRIVPRGTDWLVHRPSVRRHVYGTHSNVVGVIDLEGTQSPHAPLRNYARAGVDLSPDGRYLALVPVVSRRVMIHEIDPPYTRRLPFPSAPGPRGYASVFDLAFSADSRSLYAASIDGTVRVFGVEPGDSSAILAEDVQGGAIRVALTEAGILIGGHHIEQQSTSLTLLKPDGSSSVVAHGLRRFVAIAEGPESSAWALTESGEVFRLELTAGAIQLRANMSDRVQEPTFRSMSLMPHGGPLLLAHVFGVLAVDPLTLAGDRSIILSRGIREVHSHPTEPGILITASDDGKVRVWRLNEGDSAATLIREFGAHPGPIYTLAIHPNGRLIASGGGAPESRDVRIWDWHTGRQLAALDLFEMGIFDVEFSPDGRWLAAAGEVRMDRPEEGGQVFLIDLLGPHRAIAGNLEYHIARYTRDHGHEPSQAAGLRRLFPLVAGPSQ